MALNHNYFGIETATTPEWTVSNGMVAKVVDAAGAQTIRVALGGKLEITGSNGANIFILEGVRQADCYIYRSGSTAIIINKGVEIFRDTMTVANQSIVFGGDTSNTQILTSAGGFKLGSATLSSIDTTAPVFASATVNGVSLVMSYNDANLLDPTNIPDVTAFTVMTNSVNNAVTAVTVDGAAKTVTLILTTAVTSSQVVTVAYSDPTVGNDLNAIQDAAGNDAVSFSAVAVTNNTIGDLIAPTLVSSTPADNTITAMVTSNIVLNFSESIQAGSGNLILSDGTDVRTISISDANQVTISGSTVTINPTTDLIAGSTYSLQIAAGVIKDLAGNNYAGVSDTTSLNFSTLDNVNHTVKLSAAQASDYLSHGLVFDYTTIINVNGTGTNLTSLASNLHNLGGSNVVLNASDDSVVLTQLQASDTLVYGGVSFDHSDAITLSGVTPMSLVSSVIGLGGGSIQLTTTVDNTLSIQMDASSAVNVSAGHWYFNATNDNLTYWDSVSLSAHTIALTGVINTTVTGSGIMTLLI